MLSSVKVDYIVRSPVTECQEECEEDTPAAEADHDFCKVSAVDASRTAAGCSVALFPATEQHHPNHVEGYHEERVVDRRANENAWGIIGIVAEFVDEYHIIDEPSEKPRKGLQKTEIADLLLHVKGVVFP